MSGLVACLHPRGIDILCLLVDMGMEDSLPTFTTFVECIRTAHRNLTYIHAIESRLHGNEEEEVSNEGSIQTSEACARPRVIPPTLL